MKQRLHLTLLILLTSVCGFLDSAIGQTPNAYQGLWVGSVTLRTVNQVTSSFDKDNIEIVEDPRVPTPTFDDAYLRIIVHVDGSGKARLLKDVAILSTVPPTGFRTNEADLVLVTDAKQFANFPPQSGTRVGSAAFDFPVDMNELELAGVFAPGSGDTNRVSNLTEVLGLGAAGLAGEIVLPINHPTNPFRHARHPDHKEGFEIKRKIRLDFDDVVGNSLESAGFGVSRISGAYRDEIFGLHKSLGQNPATAPVGLKTQGRFELNRISHINTLNGQ
jgi:hypothetical protein